MGNEASHTKEEEQQVDDGRVPAMGKARDMSLPQLSKFDGSKGEGSQVVIALNGEIFDVSNDVAALKEEGDLVDWFGKNKVDAAESQVEAFRAKYHCLGKVIEQRVITPEELARCNGEDGAPIYIAARGLVFDASSGASFYGPGGGYHLFAGHNAQRALALMSLRDDDVKNTSLDDLEPKDLKVLDDWIERYYEKYPLVGTLQEKEEESSQQSGQEQDSQEPPAPKEQEESTATEE